jgi:hypothetical protein
LCICSNLTPITYQEYFSRNLFENSANTYLKNPQSYLYQPQTGSKVVTYSLQKRIISNGGPFAFYAVLFLAG